MGLFSSRKEPPRDQWMSICGRIANGLSEVRRSWFDACVDLMAAEFAKPGVGNEFIVVNLEIGGRADQAIRAQQLLICSGKLAGEGYISPRNGRDFADVLFAAVCGGELGACMTLFARYSEVEGGTRLFRFCGDVAGYMTEEESPLAQATTLAPMITPLTVGTCYVVAEAFGDQAEAARLRKKMTEA